MFRMTKSARGDAHGDVVFAVVVDPWRVRAVMSCVFSDDVVYEDDVRVLAPPAGTVRISSVGWVNGRAIVAANRGFDTTPVLRRSLRGPPSALDRAPEARRRVTCARDGGDRAGWRRGSHRPRCAAASTRELAFLVNAGVALPPTELEARVRSALTEAAQHASHHREEVAR